MGDAVDRALAENHALIAAILEHHSSGRDVPAVALLERLQINLEFVAAVAEHGLPLVPPPYAAPLPPAPLAPSAPRAPLATPVPQPSLALQLAPALPSVPLQLTVAVPQHPTLAPAPVVAGPRVAPAAPAAPAASAATAAAAVPSSSPLSPQSLGARGLLRRGAEGSLSGVRTGGMMTNAWSAEEHARFEHGMRMHGREGRDGKPNFKGVATEVGTRTPVQVRSHYQKIQKRAARDGSSGSAEAGRGGAASITRTVAPQLEAKQASLGGAG